MKGAKRRIDNQLSFGHPVPKFHTPIGLKGATAYQEKSRESTSHKTRKVQRSYMRTSNLRFPPAKVTFEAKRVVRIKRTAASMQKGRTWLLAFRKAAKERCSKLSISTSAILSHKAARTDIELCSCTCCFWQPEADLRSLRACRASLGIASILLVVKAFPNKFPAQADSTFGQDFCSTSQKKELRANIERATHRPKTRRL